MSDEYVVTFTSMTIEADSPEEAISRAGDFKGGGHWEAEKVGEETLFAIPGCGRCADLVALGLLGGQVYDTLREHQVDHVPSNSFWPSVNELARQINAEKEES